MATWCSAVDGCCHFPEQPRKAFHAIRLLGKYTLGDRKPTGSSGKRTLLDLPLSLECLGLGAVGGRAIQEHLVRGIQGRDGAGKLLQDGGMQL